ncbi:MAG: methyltransferase domain-containing protein [Candidatus Margulisiibacteriota bacterium]|jgi:malonyl-CoA O-methyltransferase
MGKELIKRNFSRGAAAYDSEAILQKEMADRLYALTGVCPTRILDLGCGTGYLTRRLAEKFPLARVVGVDIAPGMIAEARERNQRANIKYLVADGEQYNDGQYDLIVANASLQWMKVEKVFNNVLKLLLPGGRFVFATFGPGTLAELKACGFRINDFPAPVKLAESLKSFSQVEVKTDLVRQTFPGVKELVGHLRSIGANSPINSEKPGKITGLKKRPFTASYEVIIGTAIK